MHISFQIVFLYFGVHTQQCNYWVVYGSSILNFACVCVGGVSVQTRNLPSGTSACVSMKGGKPQLKALTPILAWKMDLTKSLAGRDSLLPCSLDSPEIACITAQTFIPHLLGPNDNGSSPALEQLTIQHAKWEFKELSRTQGRVKSRPWRGFQSGVRSHGLE